VFSVRCLGSKNEASHVLDIGGVAELGTHTNPPFNRELIGQRTAQVSQDGSLYSSLSIYLHTSNYELQIFIVKIIIVT